MPPSAPPASTAAQTQTLPAPANTIVTAAAIDVAAVKRAVEMVRNRKQSDANEVKKNISDPAAKKLVERVILRSDDSWALGFRALCGLHHRQPAVAEHRHLAAQGRSRGLPRTAPPNAQIQAFFSQYTPLSAKGKFALARAYVAAGNHCKEAEGVVRDAWRYDTFSQDVETRVAESFSEFLTNADHKARMDRRLYVREERHLEAGLCAPRRGLAAMKS